VLLVLLPVSLYAFLQAGFEADLLATLASLLALGHTRELVCVAFSLGAPPDEGWTSLLQRRRGSVVRGVKVRCLTLVPATSLENLVPADHFYNRPARMIPTHIA
jgi:hypothetical protein